MSGFQTIRNYISLVKFSHTVFALPFAMIGFAYGMKIHPERFSWWLLVYVLLCMVFARNAAMGFNRYIDRKIDEKNPRTAKREIPSGMIGPKNALLFVAANSLLFILTAYLINPLCFLLSPLALLIVLGYSLTKRVTPLCHLVLGLGLSIAPAGAYIALTGGLAWPPVLLSALVVTWVSAFDILYALQDRDFDCDHGLFSIPSVWGIRKAVAISVSLHCCTAILVIVMWYILPVSGLYWIGAGAFILLLVYQHVVVRPSNFSRVDSAFALLNGTGSVFYSVFTILAMYF